MLKVQKKNANKNKVDTAVMEKRKKNQGDQRKIRESDIEERSCTMEQLHPTEHSRNLERSKGFGTVGRFFQNFI